MTEAQQNEDEDKPKNMQGDGEKCLPFCLRGLCADVMVFDDELLLALFSVFQLLKIPKFGIRSILRFAYFTLSN